VIHHAIVEPQPATAQDVQGRFAELPSTKQLLETWFLSNRSFNPIWQVWLGCKFLTSLFNTGGIRTRSFLDRMNSCKMLFQVLSSNRRTANLASAIFMGSGHM